VRWWRRYAAVDPLDAQVAAQLMRAPRRRWRRRRRAAARAHLRSAVQQELELPADSAVLELARRIRAGEFTPPSPRAEVAHYPPPPSTPRQSLAAESASRVAPGLVPVVAPTAEPHLATPSAAVAPPDARRAHRRWGGAHDPWCGGAVGPVAFGVAGGRAAATVGILPFGILSGHPEDAFLGAGVVEEILHLLALHPEPPVLARSVPAELREATPDVTELADRLRVQAFLEGSVRRCGERLRITVRLVDPATGTPRWTTRCDGAAGDLFALQDAVAEEVARQLRGADWQGARA
jgi:TolB-like protein